MQKSSLQKVSHFELGTPGGDASSPPTGALRATLILLTQLLVDVGDIKARTINMHCDHKTRVPKSVSEGVQPQIIPYGPKKLLKWNSEKGNK